MSCCCGKKKSSKNGAVTTTNPNSPGETAPTQQTMADRVVSNDNERAVVRGSNMPPNNDTDNKTGERVPSHSRSSSSMEQQEASRQPLGQQHPLEKPYEIQSREVPLNPKQGDVLHPPKSALQTAQYQSRVARNDKNVVEIFRPEVSTSWAGPIRLTDSPTNHDASRNDTVDSSRQSQNHDAVVERITAIEPAGSEDYLDDPPSKKAASEKGSLLLVNDHDRRKLDPSSQKTRKRSSTESRKLSDPIPQMRTPARPSPPESKRALIGFGKAKTTSKSRDDDNDGDDDEHLSDVPSDVDSVTRDRYLLACHLLKNAMMQKEKALEPLEREFLMTLLSDYENEVDDTSVINEDQITAVEQATQRLENDPLFLKPNDDNNLVVDVDAPGDQENPVSPPSAIATAARQIRESIQNARQRLPEPATDSQVHPKRTFPFVSNPCNTKTADDVGSPADIVLLIQTKTTKTTMIISVIQGN